MANDPEIQNENPEPDPPALSPKKKSKAGWFFILVVIAIMGLIIAKDSLKSINWQKDYPTALKMAQDQQRPLLIFFYSNTDSLSKRMDTVTYADLKVAKYVTNTYIPVKLDFRDNKNVEFIQKFDVTTSPTSVVFLPDRELHNSISGFVSIKEFNRRLNDLLQRLRKAPE